MMQAWTLLEYRDVCEAIHTAGYQIQTVHDYLTNPKAHSVILRHDVDRFPRNALKMARLEHELEVSATYYVRMTRSVFKPEIISKLYNLGHEVGYHYEVLARTRGDVEHALSLFEGELSKLRRIVPIKTACAHGSPLSQWSNLELWEHSTLADFQLVGEPYIDIDYSEMAYYTDTGRAWDATSTNLRDRVSSSDKSFPTVRSTSELIHLIKGSRLSQVCVQTHPERWNATYIGWLRSAVWDYGTNVIKIILRGLMSGS